MAHKRWPIWQFSIDARINRLMQIAWVRHDPSVARTSAEFLRPIPRAWKLAGGSRHLRVSIREDIQPITGNASRFLPHAIL